jgi:beta-1,2-mannobiose phosphorylase / 1,2-beta-oligomannan phosphorylase
MKPLTDKTALVAGASRGLGRGVAEAFLDAGAVVVALAASRDLRRWQRLGVAHFAVTGGLDLNALDNKDAVLFPEPVPGPDGKPSLALIHRPSLGDAQGPAGQAAHPPGMWISYAPWREAGDLSLNFDQHHFLAGPRTGWERLKVGAGAPPSRVGTDWLLIYHGVTGQIVDGVDQQKHVRYSAGAMLLDGQDPRHVLYRTSESILEPTAATARVGIVPNVVFPTGVDLHANGELDVYYGMADTRIGVARGSLADLRWPAMPLAA